ncbi:hypothetical protein [Roseibium sp.]|uniref:hypothetical protein n=1 Tax=Roseibium sp. TaxID=1936156 RepID=UPI003BB14611
MSLARQHEESTAPVVQLPDLRPDCSACAALCCVVFPFDKSESFAIDKGAGEVCPNLDDCNKCRVFDGREALGFKGCITYDCFGAGQLVSQIVFKGRSWRDDPALANRMGAALSVLRRIHEQLLLLGTAEKLPLDKKESARLDGLRLELAPDADWTEQALADYPIDATISKISRFLRDLRRHVAPQTIGRS